MGKPKNWLGLDIGGANLKAAMTDGFACEVPFPLWQRPDDLPAAIAELVASAPPHRGLVVTMTGELADCYATKSEGVSRIVAAVELAAEGRETRYYSQTAGDGAWLSSADATTDWRPIAAANWHALATACRWFFHADIAIDIGSTTTDITDCNRVQHEPLTDTNRLLSGGLVYLGVGRTPLCAVVDELPYRGRSCPVAAERFATTADVALLLDYLPESNSTDTADGRPMTKANAVARIGRMLCADAAEFNAEDAAVAARAACRWMEERITGHLRRLIVETDAASAVVAGGGAWLARSALARAGLILEVIDLADEISTEASRCAPAWALAALMDEWSKS